MAIESQAAYVDDLNPNNPLPDDYISEGDDHIKLIKQVLKTTFPTADRPLTIEFEDLNNLDDFVDFTVGTDTSGNTTRTLELNDVNIRGAAVSTVANSLTTYAQVQAMITQLMNDRMYPVDSYYITESSARPETILGFGNWTRVSGFIVGAGSIQPIGSLPGINFAAGTTGGNTAVNLQENQMPVQYVDGSSFTTTTESHSHEFLLGGGNADGNDSGSDEGLLHQNQRFPHTYRTNATSHQHGITGRARIGHDTSSLQPVMTIPPYRATNIWRRLADTTP